MQCLIGISLSCYAEVYKNPHLSNGNGILFSLLNFKNKLIKYNCFRIRKDTLKHMKL